MSVSSLFSRDSSYDLYVRNLTVEGTLNANLRLENEGDGAQVYDTGTRASLRSITGTTNGISVEESGDVIVVDNTLTGSNLAPAAMNTARVFSAKNGDLLEMRTIIGGLNVTVNETNTGIEISASGVSGLSGAANEGGGAGVFDTVSDTTLLFRSLVATTNGISVTQGATTITVDNTLTVDSVGAGVPFFVAKSGSLLQFRGLAVGTGGLSIIGSGNLVTVDNTLTGSNIGSGSQLFSSKNGALLQFRSLTAGANIALTQNTNDITIDATGILTTLANEGAGAEVWDNGTQGTLRTLVGTANGITVTQGATSITVDNTLTGANLGTGTGLFATKSGSSLQFNSIAAGSGIGVSLAANTITIANSGVTTPLTNSGGGAQVYDTGSTSTLRTLLGTANGLTVTQGASDITVDNTLTGSNLGTGTGVFSAKSGSSLQFNSIAAGSGIGLNLASNTISVSATRSVWLFFTPINHQSANSVWFGDNVQSSANDLVVSTLSPVTGTIVQIIVGITNTLPANTTNTIYKNTASTGLGVTLPAGTRTVTASLSLAVTKLDRLSILNAGSGSVGDGYNCWLEIQY